MATSKISLQLDQELLRQVEEEAEKNDQFRTTWIAGAIHQRLGHGRSPKNYSRCVAAALSAGRGKLNRHEAMAIAAKVITAFNE